MKKRIGRKGTALAAALVLLSLTAWPGAAAYGAGGIDTENEDYQITFDLSTSYQEQKPDGTSESLAGNRFAALNEEQITVNLYRVASVDASGNYTALTPYQALNGRLGAVSSETTAQIWAELAAAAYAVVSPAADAGDGETPAPGDTPVKTVTFAAKDGGVVKDLKSGLYLAAAEDVLTEEYIYHFTPYLVSLPGNKYDPPAVTDDTWQKEVTVGLKPGEEPRYGSLRIEKTLKSYNQTLGGASFIFEIRAEKGGAVVYSDVRSLTFDAVGTKSVMIAEKIPVGATVTVTEVYSGACYEQTVKEQEKDRISQAGETIEVKFTNDYDGRIHGGSSIVNAFEPDAADPKKWNHGKLKDSLGELIPDQTGR